MRTAIVTLLLLALLGALIYGVWRAIRAARHKPVEERHPSWWVIPIAVIALFIGIGIAAPSDSSQTADNASKTSTRDADETATATPTATPTAKPTPTAAQRR